MKLIDRYLTRWDPSDRLFWSLTLLVKCFSYFDQFSWLLIGFFFTCWVFFFVATVKFWSYISPIGSSACVNLLSHITVCRIFGSKSGELSCYRSVILNFSLGSGIFLSSRIYSYCVISAYDNVRIVLINSDPEFVFDWLNQKSWRDVDLYPYPEIHFGIFIFSGVWIRESNLFFTRDLFITIVLSSICDQE